VKEHLVTEIEGLLQLEFACFSFHIFYCFTVFSLTATCAPGCKSASSCCCCWQSHRCLSSHVSFSSFSDNCCCFAM